MQLTKGNLQGKCMPITDSAGLLHTLPFMYLRYVARQIADSARLGRLKGNKVMKHKLIAAALTIASVFTASAAFAGSAKEDSVERLQMSTGVLKQIMDAPDKGIPEEVLSDAKCVVVV